MKVVLRIVLSCAILSATSLKAQHVPKEVPVASYDEKHRPQFHFSPPTKWMNDPNGMVYYEGEYHLFYQHYPDGTVWGPMHWGHAVSPDMVNWQNLPIALYPDSLGYIFSGSAVVDWKNTSGLGKNGQPPLIAIFTYHDPKGEKSGRTDYQTQGIAYSNDKGRTWTKYAQNPVVANPGIRDFRDPKVRWDEGTKQWIMVLAAQDQVQFWASKDLKSWQHLSDFGKQFGSHGGVWECPDFFPMKVGNTTKWVLLLNINPGGPNGGSGVQYFVGNFDGKTFRLDDAFAAAVGNEKAVWLDHGRDNYAGVTWSDVPKSDGRRLFLGWMSNWDYANVVPTAVWRSANTLPRTLELRQTPDGYRLAAQPVKELEKLRTQSFALGKTTVNGTLDLTGKLGFVPTQSEVLLELEKPASGIFRVELSNARGERYSIGYNATNNQFFSDRTQSGDLSFSDKFGAKIHVAPRSSKDKTIRLHLFFDVASAELFADNGTTAMTEIFFPSDDFNRISLVAEGKPVTVLKGTMWQLKTIWKSQ